MKAVFADTFYWIALTNPQDSYHRRVQHSLLSLGSRTIVTTGEVLTEFLAYCASDPQLRVEAVLVVQDILNSDGVIVIPQTHSSFVGGLELYRARPDKGYSLTDCISMRAMQTEGLLDVLTNDRHFQQEGFQAIFRDL